MDFPKWMVRRKKIQNVDFFFLIISSKQKKIIIKKYDIEIGCIGSKKIFY